MCQSYNRHFTNINTFFKKQRQQKAKNKSEIFYLLKHEKWFNKQI